MKAGFAGLGNMGSTMANLIAENRHEVIGWDYSASVVKEINERHTNGRYLPGVRLSPRIKATGDLFPVFRGADVVFVAMPSLFIEGVLGPMGPSTPTRTVIVNLAKGIDKRTGRTSSQLLSRIFSKNPHVMLSGPSIANEVAQGMPTAVVLAGSDPKTLRLAASLLDNRHFDTRFSPDRTGVELGGILKNVYAIGLGIFDGEGIRSINFRSVYLTLALEEMAALGVKLGAKKETFYGLSGLGDLFATSLSRHSHNRKMGELLARGMPVEKIRAKMGVLAEGYNTLDVALSLARKKKVRMPIAEGLRRVMSGSMKAKTFIHSIIREGKR